MLVVIHQVLCSTNFVSMKDPIDSSILNLFFLVLLTTMCFRIKINLTFEHALHRICIWEALVY
jgi:hypothetical protein